MHRTVHAIKHLIIAGFGLCLAWGSEPQRAGRRVLDLTKQSTSELHSMGVPGQSSGGMVGGSPEPALDLPVRLEITRTRFTTTSVALELTITNIGDSPIDVPSCLDGSKAFSAGALNHRSMEFGLAVHSGPASTSDPIEVTFGSSAPECSTHVQPKGTLSVRMESATPDSIQEMRKEGARISLRAFVSEVSFEDHRYYITARSKRIYSQSVQSAF